MCDTGVIKNMKEMHFCLGHAFIRMLQPHSFTFCPYSVFPSFVCSPHATARDAGPAFTMAAKAPEPISQDLMPGPGGCSYKSNLIGQPAVTKED